MEKEELIFGLHPLLETIQSGQTINKVLIQKGLHGELSKRAMDELKAHDIPYQFVPVQKLNRVTKKNHQGIIGYISPVDFYELDDILEAHKEKDLRLLVLDRITDVRNFGAICRTAECMGVETVVVPSKGMAAINADALKTSAGALMNVKVCKEASLKIACEKIKAAGIAVLACTEKTEKTIFETELPSNLAIVMGSEETGVSTSILKLADLQCKIPMEGKTQSLNVSVACGMILFEFARQRDNHS